MQITLPAPETDIVDTYTGLSLKVAKAKGYPAAEVVSIRVSTTVLAEDSEVYGTKVGDILVSVDPVGYELTAKGERIKNRRSSSVYGLRDAEDRWEVARAAVLASLARHGLDPTKVVDMDLRPYAEMKADQQARLLAQFGIEQEG